MYTLTCTVTVVENLVAQPTVEWLDSNNNTVSGSDITVGSVMSSGNGMFTLTLEFNPLHTSHGGQYTCRATHDNLGITINNPTGSMTEEVIVESECVNNYTHMSVTVVSCPQFHSHQ